ncbi:MmgE/PrpD family protein [Novosphingobium rosa]|uniref:MmgE/PrpD family protein n=1 Tax=Novosphingobium rosa TaxID=76978 RepID=UPI001C3FCA7D|nr:MmgE/PrpD family protein [Novosphingobium rosa]
MALSASLVPAVSAAQPNTQAAPALPQSSTSNAERLIGGRTLTAIVASYASQSRAEAIPPAVRERAKKVIFDEMACACFGRRSPAGEMTARYAAMYHSAGETRIYGTDLRAPLPYAALANGTAGHGFEVDGAHVIGGHPGASIVHAATATAELHKSSGADLINAVVLGYDIGVRMVEACGGLFAMIDRRHLQSDFLFSLGCCAASGRLMGLSAEQQAHAWALTTFQANGLNALFAEKHHISKSFCNGQYAFGGVSGALLASIGMEGNEDIIGAKDGVLDAWGDGQHDAAVTAGLGQAFKIMGANFKFFNAGYPIHAAIEAAMGAITRDHIPTDTIASIHVGMPRAALAVVDNRAMHNICVQDMVAANIAAGGLKLADEPFPAMLSNPTYVRLRAAITAGVDPDLQRDAPEGRGARVTIVTRDGKQHALRVDNPRGHSLRGEISWNDLADKWRGSLPHCDVDATIRIASSLETLPQAETLFAAFGTARV